MTPLPYSYKTDPSVPHFDAGEVFTVMDSQCSLCARAARWIASNDRRRQFKIVPLQSAIGQALMQHYGLDPHDPASWLFIDHGDASSSLDAFIRVGWRLGGIWRAMAVLRILPRAVQDWLYVRVARNRYRLFGTTDMCSVPDQELQHRLMTFPEPMARPPRRY
ncbi:MAG: DCC1-like thiol-disulfide oxidoreductase family protein [Pseudomonadota bacterium]